MKMEGVLSENNMLINYLGIYPEEMEKALKAVYNAIEEFAPKEYDENDDKIVNAITFKSHNFTNEFINTIFSVTQTILEPKGYNVNYYVNGYDSHLYVNNKEM